MLLFDIFSCLGNLGSCAGTFLQQSIINAIFGNLAPLSPFAILVIGIVLLIAGKWIGDVLRLIGLVLVVSAIIIIYPNVLGLLGH